MKNFCLFILILCFAVSCSNPAKHSSKYRAQKNKNMQRVASKFANRVKPSESMQAGLSKDYIKSENLGMASLYPEEEPQEFREDKSLQVYAYDEDEDGDVQDAVGDTKNYTGVYKIGNPYEIFGVSYVPQDYDDYEEIGMSSWYGDDFHGKQTANGEIYNMGSLTAAHRTLPLPSLIKVTNLRNGKTVVVRVNDRGPFAKGRIIDVSEKAATILGFKDRGTTQVKIELLRNETDEMLARLKIQKLKSKTEIKN
jgi:rare lipoprotein A (peptidoglycan hydrolase)